MDACRAASLLIFVQYLRVVVTEACPASFCTIASCTLAFARAVQKVRLRSCRVNQPLEVTRQVSTRFSPRSETNTYWLTRNCSACPFLKSGEVCGIHPARPAACREHNVTSPAELCQDPFGNQVRPLPMAIRMNSVLARLWAQEKDETAQFLPMPIALEWAREHRAERAPVAEGPALFGRFLGVLGRAGRARPEGEPGEAES